MYECMNVCMYVCTYVRMYFAERWAVGLDSCSLVAVLLSCDSAMEGMYCSAG